MKKKFAVLSLSGGMDSSTLLLHLLGNGYTVVALSFDYGQKHHMELDRAKSLVSYIQNKGYLDRLTHSVIELKGLSQLLHSSLVVGGEVVPEGHYEAENMKATVVPNRNKIFSSIIQAVALSISEQNEGSQVDIAMGIHGGDHAIYPDCRQEFRDVDFKAFEEGNWGTENVHVYTPYLDTDKLGILRDGQGWCAMLELDFNKVYSMTNTSYKPICHDNGHTHVWYSDYKSASSVERVEAFISLGIADPVAYADETGPVEWEVAKAHVEKVLRENK